METKKNTKMVSFCCAQHGPLSDQVKYISIVFGDRTLADFPIVYCKKCKKYYTPYKNLLAFATPPHLSSFLFSVIRRCKKVLLKKSRLLNGKRLLSLLSNLL